MFTKMFFPASNAYFLENRPAPVLGNIRQAEIAPLHQRPWMALNLVLCAHLVVFAALRPQLRHLPVETIPEPIMISLLGAPQATSQQTVPPAALMEKAAKPIKKPVKKPVRKPAAPHIKPTVLPSAPSVEQPQTPATEANAPSAEPAIKTSNSKPADTPTYQPPSFNAAYLNNPAPNYPSVSRRLGEQGRVLLRVQVMEDGTAGSVELQAGSGFSRLDQAALEAVKKWRFMPAKRGEQAVSASVVVPVRFSIEG